MNKRGIVSIFIIFGLLFLLLFGFFLKQNSLNLQNDAESIALFGQTQDSVETYVKGCIDFTVMDLRDKLWIANDANMVKDYLDEHYMECIGDFSPYREQKFDFSYNLPEFSTEIINENLFVNMNFSIEMVKGSKKTKMEFFEYRKLDYAKEEIPEGFEMIYRNIIYNESYFETETATFIPYYVIKIALEDPGISFLVTPHQIGLQRVIDFQNQYNPQIAINGAQWNITPGAYKTNSDGTGFTASLGNQYSPPVDGTWVTVFISENNKVTFSRKPTVIYNALTGSNIIVVDSDVGARIKNKNDPNHKDGYETRRPRTSIGLDEENNYLIIIVSVGGGPTENYGFNLRELAYLQLEHGASYAINMDGGGSSTLVMQDKGIVYAAETGGRPVANHLGIYGEPYESITD